jgi:TetR/AcrR family transcriptional regulator
MAAAAAAPQRVQSRSERTRRELLEAAEFLFAERGFHATRLEDVAERVGIRKPSLLYHFPDKRALYDAVLGELVGGLMTRLQGILGGDSSLADSIEAAVDAWVSYVGERPAIARILLREVADARPGYPSLFVQHALPLLGLMNQTIRAGQRRKIFLGIDPIHLASTVTGATVFFLLGTPLLGDSWPHDPRSESQLEQLRQELRRVTRRLLGLTGATPRKRTRPMAPAPSSPK